jgi:hypothetical protein
MKINYKEVSYFQTRPDVVKIFDDLDNYLDFCRLELLPYDPADLYNKQSKVWQQYEASRKPRRYVDKRTPRGMQSYRTRN